MKVTLTVIFTILGLIIIALIFIYSGIYNVSAIKPETGLSRWVLNTTMDNSVERHAKDIRVPNLDDPSMLRDGVAHYKEMCEVCHRAPGKKESELSKGLNPSAPDLVKIGKKLDPAETFWIIKNGIKMTGMPAWGPTLSDEKIWNMVAAVKKLHDISSEEYNSLPAEGDEHEDQEKTRK